MRLNSSGLWPALAGLILYAGSPAAPAFEIDTNSELRLRWDTRLAYIGALRLESPDSRLLGNISKDDVNRNFGTGSISSRGVFESGLTLAYELFSVRINGLGVYDQIYNETTDHDSPDTSNQAPYNQFSLGTRDVLGRRAELQDAFVSGEFEWLDGTPLLFSAGRQSVVWGQTLFYPQNGIQMAMAPFDTANATKDPTETGLTADQVSLPLLQVSAQTFLPGNFNLSGYYQFEWRKSRFSPAGAYLSGSDVFDEGGDRILVRTGNQNLNSLANYYLVRSQDIVPSDQGQGGLRLFWSFPEHWPAGVLGFYALQFHSREPTAYIRFEPGVVPISPGGNLSLGNLNVNATQSVLNAAALSGGYLGEFAYVYGGPKARLYGASVKTEFRTFLGQTQLGGEISYRQHVPLVSEIIQTTRALTELSAEEPLHAMGDTAHAQLSLLGLPGRAHLFGTKLWDKGLLLAEVAWQGRVRVSRNAERVDMDKRREATVARVQFTPTWRRVLSDRLDLSFIASIAHTIRGNSGVMQGFASDGDGAGEARGGLRLNIGSHYTTGLHYSHFYGGPRIQDRADKDYLAWGISAKF